MDEGYPLHARVEAIYRTIAATRMAGLPVLNPQLDVALRGLRRYGAMHVGVLVTPWFMNLLFLPVEAPGEAGSAPALRVGAARTFLLPSGPYEALAGYEEGLGWHWSCSLFSPMFEFADMDSAVQTADLSLELLFTPPEVGAREDGDGARGEDFRAAMIQPKGAGSAEQRLEAMAVEEAAAAQQASRAEPRTCEPVAAAAEAGPHGSGLDRRALFGLGRSRGRWD